MITEREVEASAKFIANAQGYPDKWNLVLAIAKGALEAAEKARWQPIETAPNGLVLLVDLDGFVTTGVFRGTYWTTTGGQQMTPTRWQPLPSPPESIA